MNKALARAARATPRSRTAGLKLPAPLIDERGVIQPLVDAAVKSVVMISSRKGTVRANHYHKTNSHYCYVVTGAIDYFERPAGSRKKPRKTRFAAGQLFYTAPMVEHAMLFPEDTVFLVLSRNARRPASMARDTVPVDLFTTRISRTG